MLRNLILSAWRSLLKKVGFTLTNVFGLAIGMTTCMAIFLYVDYDLSYDEFQDDDVYRMWINRVYPEREVNYPLAPHSFGPQMVQDFPEIIAQGRAFKPFNPTNVTVGDDSYLESNIIFADSFLLSVLHIPLKIGNTEEALSDANSVVLSESIAMKLFGNDDPMGKTVEFFGASKKVTGVAYDYPNNSHFIFDYLTPMHQFPFFNQENWVGFSAMTYLKLQQGTDPMVVEEKLPAFVKQYAEGPIQQRNGISYDEYIEAGNGYNYHLMHVKDIHLHSNLENEMKANGNINYVYIFSVVAIFILVIACINFMNLSTARSTERGKEVGIRKVLGSAKQHLIAQFLTESILMSFFSALLAFGIVALILPWFNELAARPLGLEQVMNPLTLLSSGLIVVIIGALAGLYPAFFISSFTPLSVLKGKLRGSKTGINLRNALVVLQFAISIILISATLIVFNQMEYMQNKPLGFEKDNIIVIENAGAINGQSQDIARFETFKNEIDRLPNVKVSAYSSNMPGDQAGDFSVRIPGTGQKESMIMRQMSFDDDLPETMQMQVLEGRFFSKGFEDSLSIVLNQSAVEKLGLTDPVGRKLIEIAANAEPREYTIVGVINDFHFQSLHVDLKPAAFTSMQGPFQNRSKMVISVQESDIQNTLSSIESKWAEFAPQAPFKSYFLDANMEAFYESELATGRIFSIFTLLAILIACIGLLGLSAFVINQRVKEIGVRKVLGATVPQIVLLLSSDFMKLVGIASILAVPIAYYWMDSWLESFAYSTGVNWFVFVLAAGLALIIGLGTVSFQSIKAAIANPVNSLKDE
ncbi:MAG: ABC transporter permease [Cytophagales bacterium]|nr:ABC transporter permease [Cytophagales bacterium]